MTGPSTAPATDASAAPPSVPHAPVAKRAAAKIIPGFGLTMGYTITYLSLVALIPLSTIFLKTAGMGWERFWFAIASPRVLAAYRLSIGASFIGATANSIFGLAVAWSLVRYEFPGKAALDAIVDIPFALPTSVAGITLTAIYAENGWLGRWLAPLGIKVAFAPLGVVVALVFIGLPFVVRTVQPVLRDLTLNWKRRPRLSAQPVSRPFGACCSPP